MKTVEEEDVAKPGTLTSSETSTLVFSHFPDYAAFIADNCLIPFLKEQLKISKEMNFPLLKLVESKSDEEIIELSVGPNTHFLKMIAENRLPEFLDDFLMQWRENRVTSFNQDELTIADIQCVNMVRKKGFLKFLPRYTDDVQMMIALMEELDHCYFVFNHQLTNQYVDLLHNRITRQHAKEEETRTRLQENEQQLLRMQEISGSGSWSWDLISDKIEWTDALYSIYGIAPGTPLNFDDIISFNDPENMELIRNDLRTTLKTLSPSERYYHITLRDGTRKTLYAKSEVLATPEGQPYKMAGVIQDVTERQELIEELIHNERLYKQAQSISHMGNWSWDTDTDEMIWSDEMYQIYELDEKIDHVALLVTRVHLDDRQEITETIDNTLKTLEPYDMNYRIVLPDGRIKTLNAKGRVIGQNKKQLIGTLQDITIQKVYEKQLNEYKDFIEKITNVAPSLIRSYNINTGEYLFVNNAFETLLGYPPSRLTEGGLSFITSLVHPDDREQLLEQSAKTLKQVNSEPRPAVESVTEYKYRLRNSKGEYRWFQTYETIFERNESGDIETVINISIDITDKETAERDLHKKNIQLQFSNKNLEEYAYVVSHDLKEPLRKIATFSDRIRMTQQTTLTNESKVYLDKIITSVERMQKMIGDLLSVSTITGNKAYQPSDLNILLTEGMQPLDHKIEESNATVESDILPVISVVPSQFRQLFQNLLGNSLKFGRTNTPVNVKITHQFLEPDAVLGLHVQKANKYLKLSMEDNGIGFDNEYGAKIFEIFQRLHGKTEYEGTGIGLAICKKIMENHGGVIYASGEVGEGATFTMIFPANMKS
jgi:PAS domain S-box-containing protein